MANSRVLLADLKSGCFSNTAEVRLLRFGEARNVRRGGQLMSVDLLFVDENSTLTQGSISANRQLLFRERLSEGCVYTLSGFDVTRSNQNYRLCDAPLSIRFNDGISLEKMMESSRPIPTEVFRFLPYNQILELANTGRQLPDVLGELSAIRSTITDRIGGAQRVMLTLRLESGENVCVSMFDSMALAFHTKFDAYGKEPRVVIATSLNPKLVGGGLPDHGIDTAGSSSNIFHAQKIETLTISELNQFINTADSQIIEFLCTAKVTGIELDEGWCYIGCSTCSKKLVREISSFTCLSCDETNAVASLRYRVTMTVSDNSDTASFLAFDMEMAKLANIQASEAAQIVGVGVDAQVDTDLPKCLADIVEKNYTFQLKLNDFNFSTNHQTFTISRIFPERALAPMPAFCIDSDQNVAEEAQPKAVVSEIVVNAFTGADMPSNSDASSVKRPPLAKEAVDVEENIRKKAHVE